MGSDRWATFDCYGTLIDWMSGIRATLERLWPARDAERLLLRYHEIEPRVEAAGTLAYRDVLAESLARLAARERLPLASGDEAALGRSLPAWPVFPDAPGALGELRRRGWKLAILSNTDPDLLTASLRAIAEPVDLQLTALEVGSYKPAHGHWHEFRDRSSVARDRHVHVGASAFHDMAPCVELAIPFIWINRRREASDLPRAGELPDLSRLPDALDGLVPR